VASAPLSSPARVWRPLALLLALLLASTLVLGPPASASDAGAAAANDPFAGRTLYVDPDSHARDGAADARADGDEERARLFDRIGDHAQADWIGDWFPTSQVQRVVDERVARITRAGAYPVLVLYAIPVRDCDQYSQGGFDSADAYLEWVQEVAAGIGDRAAAVVLEPDSVALMHCLSSEERDERLATLKRAVSILGEGEVAVYLDGGHSNWHSTQLMADRLRAAGVEEARGVALNVSNFRWTEDELAYGRELSARLGGAHFVIDTSRNGQGPRGDEWCNPAGRGLGPTPRVSDTGDPHADALLWIKRPGESDGACGRDEPQAGDWWPDYALGLAAERHEEPADDEPDDGDARDDEPDDGDARDDEPRDRSTEDRAGDDGRGDGRARDQDPTVDDRGQGTGRDERSRAVPSAPRDACPEGLRRAGFADTRGSVHERVIDCMSWWGITSGVAPDAFAPGDDVRRDQVATFLHRVLDRTELLPAAPPSRGFRDVPTDHPHRRGIEVLAGLEVINGTGDGRFSPGLPATRGQMASLIVRLHEEVVGASVAPSPQGFSDTAGSPHEDNIRRLVALGVTTGHEDGTFRPSQPVTRGQMAAFVMRYVEHLVAEGLAEPPA
jgi:endoglucanase